MANTMQSKDIHSLRDDEPAISEPSNIPMPSLTEKQSKKEHIFETIHFTRSIFILL